ncbi:MAG: hypothetical protein HQL14_05825 [Candidatus Omnitrophica bacterium]|nr:hypothetical protein [Candidatus Omnitrophota bacterium]
MYPHDDFDYFAHASSLVFGQFPSYQKEYFDYPHLVPLGSIGSAILAAPFVFTFSLIDRIKGSDISTQRTSDNVPQSWSVFGFVFSSVFYFSLACLLLYQAVKLYVKPDIASWAVIFMAVCQGMPLFAFRRPVFSHASEFFLQSLLLYCFLRNEKVDGAFIKRWWQFVLLGVVAALVFLTRYNNLFFALVWPLFFIGRNPQHKTRGELLTQALCVTLPLIFFLVFFKWWPHLYNPNGQGYSISLVMPHGTILQIIEHLVHVFIGIDWGLIFTAPFLLLGLLGLALWKAPLKKTYILVMLPLIVNFYIIAIYGSQGGWYGYRYMFVSAFPLLVLPLAILMDWAEQRLGVWNKILMFLFALMPIVSMICFESNDLTFIVPIPQYFGLIDYSNANYQIGAWQTVLQIQQHWQDIFQGGGEYFYKLYSSIDLWYSLCKIGYQQYFPMIFGLLIKVLMIYLAPFVLWWSLSRISVRK